MSGSQLQVRNMAQRGYKPDAIADALGLEVVQVESMLEGTKHARLSDKLDLEARIAKYHETAIDVAYEVMTSVESSPIAKLKAVSLFIDLKKSLTAEIDEDIDDNLNKLLAKRNEVYAQKQLNGPSIVDIEPILKADKESIKERAKAVVSERNSTLDSKEGEGE